MQPTFEKRLYPSLRAFLQDLRFILQRRGKIKQLMQSQVVDAAFRERLMLAVTEVNGCRYCSYHLTRLALSAGVTQEEVSGIAAQFYEDCPPEQQAALLYAQHWAESEANPDPEARRHFLTRYGQEPGEQIELSLRMIRVGNLTGNMLDFLLFKLSFGRFR